MRFWLVLNLEIISYKSYNNILKDFDFREFFFEDYIFPHCKVILVFNILLLP
jgi:hypothetical protein